MKILIANSGAVGRVYMPLAAEIGLPASIILLQVDYWMNAEPHRVADGWLVMGVREMERLMHGAMKRSAISSQLRKLEAQKLIITEKVEGEKVKIKLNGEGLNTLKSIIVLDGEVSTLRTGVHITDTTITYTNDTNISKTDDDKNVTNEQTAEHARIVTLYQSKIGSLNETDYHSLTEAFVKDARLTEAWINHMAGNPKIKKPIALLLARVREGKAPAVTVTHVGEQRSAVSGQQEGGEGKPILTLSLEEMIERAKNFKGLEFPKVMQS